MPVSIQPCNQDTGMVLVCDAEMVAYEEKTRKLRCSVCPISRLWAKKARESPGSLQEDGRFLYSL